MSCWVQVNMSWSELAALSNTNMAGRELSESLTGVWLPGQCSFLLWSDMKEKRKPHQIQIWGLDLANICVTPFRGPSFGPFLAQTGPHLLMLGLKGSSWDQGPRDHSCRTPAVICFIGGLKVTYEVLSVYTLKVKWIKGMKVLILLSQNINILSYSH